jgi:hypothetical protein
MLRLALNNALKKSSITSSKASVPALVLLPKRAYSDDIVEHYENPRNVGSLDKNDDNVGTVRWQDESISTTFFLRNVKFTIPSQLCN